VVWGGGGAGPPGRGPAPLLGGLWFALPLTRQIGDDG
jgi:hypothetical protein